MKIIYIILTAMILTHCSKIEIGDWTYDPKTAMMRLTFGVSK
tara:strand:+ start:247 stop:372 length:126 start_codon:yes stop_codon:yes gene_type:complete